MRAIVQGDKLIVELDKDNMPDWMVDPDAVFTVTITGSGLHVMSADTTELDKAIDETIAQYGAVYKRLSQ